MEFAGTFVRGCRQGQEGLRERLRRGAVTLALVTLALCALSPAEASAHAGEVHSDAPQVGTQAQGPGKSGDAARDGAGAAGRPSAEAGGSSSGKASAGDPAEVPSSSPPPPPEEPDSDPLLHFAALGVAVVAGLGLLLVRRRRLEA